MAGWTNRGKYACLNLWSRTVSPATAFYMALVKTTPDADDDTMADLTQVALGNGYADGGINFAMNTL